MSSTHFTSLKAISIALALVAAAPISARAEFFSTCSVDPNLLVLTNAMLTLSTDIGTMADRILITEDKIGDMADRIVETENLMVTALEQLNQSGGVASGIAGVLLTSPATGDVVYRSNAPVLQLSNNADSYVVYISPTANFTDDQVLPLLVTPQSPLADSWSQAVQSISSTSVYIAVRSVNTQSSLSSISNAVRVNLQ